MTEMVAVQRSVDRYTEVAEPAHLWSITIAGQRVAELWVSMTTAEIDYVWVREDHRGEGLASALYRHAASEQVIYHAPPWHRTDDGSRFAERVGGPVRESCGCCAHLLADTDDDDYLEAA